MKRSPRNSRRTIAEDAIWLDAAEDMVRALESALKWYFAASEPAPAPDWVEDARAALAKARGEET